MGSCSSSGKGASRVTGGLSPNDIISTRHILTGAGEDVKSFGDVVDTLKEFNQMYGLSTDNTRLAKLKPKSNAMAFYDGDGIAINEKYFKSGVMDSAYKACVESGFHPSNGNKTAMQAVVAHELGHSLTDVVGSKLGVAGNIDTFATTIVNEAMKNKKRKDVNKFTSKISGYAKQSNAEAIAEAVSDVYCNGKKAKSESKAIVDVMNKYLKK